jgi:hypothetical protein
LQSAQKDPIFVARAPATRPGLAIGNSVIPG